jgi:hypothetical protein
MGCSFVAYVDEAGDEGFTSKKSSEWFVLSALVTDKADDAATLEGLVDSVLVLLRQRVKKPLHFRNLRHHQKVPYIAQIAAAPVWAINVLVHKPSVSQTEVFGEEHRLYHYAVRFLVERISWLCRDRKHSVGDGTFELVFSNRGGMSYTAISEYINSLIIKAGLKEAGTLVHDIRIAAGTMDAGKVLTFSHGDRMGLQVADAVASGFYNALEARYGFTEDRYARMLKPILYNYRDRGRYRGYGLKFFPLEAEKLIETDARLKWVVEDYPK